MAFQRNRYGVGERADRLLSIRLMSEDAEFCVEHLICFDDWNSELEQVSGE